jgi:hypothetical protein
MKNKEKKETMPVNAINPEGYPLYPSSDDIYIQNTYQT